MPPELTVACPVCDAQPHEPCNWNAWKWSAPHPIFHTQRGDAAAEIEVIQSNTQTTEPSDQTFDNAVDESGLV